MVVGSCLLAELLLFLQRTLIINFLLVLQWNPRSTQEVTQESLDLIFKPFKNGEELQLPLENEPRSVVCESLVS
jgi:hypothetical protein